MKQSKKELLDEILHLEKENEELKASIHKIDDIELFETISIYTARYKNAFYRKIPFSFLETVFYTHKKTLLKHASGCFIEKILDAAHEGIRIHHIPELVMHIPMYCNNVLRSGNKTVFSLSDPYRTITTKPISTLTEEEALYCKGKMIVAKILIPENHRAQKSFEMRGYVPLKMNLTNIIDKDSPTNYNTLFTQYKDIHDEKSAINAINVIESYYKSHSSTSTFRVNDFSLRILDGYTKIAVSFEKEQLWYGDEIYSYPLVSNNGGPIQGILNDEFSPYMFQDESIL